MAGGGSLALGFGSGLARGFANAFMANKEQVRQEADKAEQRKVQRLQLTLPVLLKAAEESNDYSVVEDAFTEAFGKDYLAGAKKHGSLTDHIAPLLQGPQAMQGDSFGQQPPVEGEPPVLPAKAAVAPARQPDPKSFFFGSEMPSQEQKAERQSALEIKADLAKLAALKDFRKKVAAEINLTGDEADRFVATGQLSPTPPEAFGTIPVGSGVYNRKTGEITEPPSAKTATNLTGQLGERTRELIALHPEWDEPTARTEAAKLLVGERADDRLAKEANTESIQANRAIQKTLLDMQAAQGGITPNNAAGLTTQMRRDWTKAVEPFRTRQVYVAKLNETITPDANGKTMIQRDRNAATQTIINSLNRLLEEGNTVREGEYQRSESLTPLMTWVEAQLVAVQSGGGKLTDAQLTSIAKEGIRIAKVTGDVHEAGLRDLRTAMTGQLGRYKLPAEDVFGSSKIGAANYPVTYTDPKTKQPVTQVFPSEASADAFARAAGVTR